MLNRLVTVLGYCQIVGVFTAPLPWMMQPQYQQLPWQPYQYQQQMEAMQAMQMQQFPPPMAFNWPQPIPMVLLPVDNDIITLNPDALNVLNEDLFKRINDKHIFENERQKVLATSTPQHSEKPGEEGDSVVIEAETEKKEPLKPRLLILVPNNGRFSIGGIIEAIPFLPFEINVPDSIAWAWNGISGIISGIGQRLPFRPRRVTPVNQMEAENMKLLLKNMENQNVVNSAVMPMQVFVLPVEMAAMIPPQY